MRSARTTLLIFLAVVMATSVIQSATAQEGKVFKGILKPGTQAEKHKYPMKKGNVYQIDMVSDAFDALAQLHDAKGKKVAEDDDGGENRNARLLYSPAANGEYTIVATSFSKRGQGSYELKVTNLGTGKFKSGKLDANSPKFKGNPFELTKVRLTAGKSYQINLMSGAFDTYLYVRKDGEVVASDDDGGTGLNSKLNFTPTKTGEYELLASSFSDRASGPYVLVAIEAKK